MIQKDNLTNNINSNFCYKFLDWYNPLFWIYSIFWRKFNYRNLAKLDKQKTKRMYNNEICFTIFLISLCTLLLFFLLLIFLKYKWGDWYSNFFWITNLMCCCLKPWFVFMKGTTFWCKCHNFISNNFIMFNLFRNIITL